MAQDLLQISHIPFSSSIYKHLSFVSEELSLCAFSNTRSASFWEEIPGSLDQVLPEYNQLPKLGADGHLSSMLLSNITSRGDISVLQYI